MRQFLEQILVKQTENLCTLDCQYNTVLASFPGSSPAFCLGRSLHGNEATQC